MKILKVLGIILLLIIVAGGVLFFVGPEESSYEQSIEINAPVEATWSQVKSLKAMDNWNPWLSKDPNIEKEWTGEDGTVGSKTCWDSEKEEVGAGCEEITNIEAPNKIESDLTFTRPFKSTGKSHIIVEPTENGSKVTWGMKSPNEGMFRVMMNFMDFEGMMKADFTAGLNKLKELAEAVEIKPEPQERMITAADLPETIRTFITENHPDAEFVEAEEITLGESVSYEVEMKQGEETIEMHFDGAGNPIPEVEDEEDSDDEEDDY